MRNAFTIIVPLSLIIALAGCGSYRTVKYHAENGALHEMRAYRGTRLAFTIHYEYDAAGRTTRMRKLSHPQNREIADCGLYYDQTGRLKMFALQQTITRSGRSLEDNRVKSFYYNASGGLVRTEASYKSAYSIAMNRSPLTVIDYHYAGKRIEWIGIEGGPTAGEAVLSYDGNDIDTIEYKGYTAGRDGRELARHIRYTIRGAGASSAKNLFRSGPSLSRKRMMRIFRDEKLFDALDTLMKAGNTPVIIREIEEEWLE